MHYFIIIFMVIAMIVGGQTVNNKYKILKEDLITTKEELEEANQALDSLEEELILIRSKLTKCQDFREDIKKAEEEQKRLTNKKKKKKEKKK